MSKTVSIFVDVQNIYYTTREVYGAHFDYNAFWAKVGHGRSIARAYAYAIDRGDEKQRQFQNILRAIGFTVKLKPYIQRSDGSTKGDWDVGIALDMLEQAGSSDVMVLASGDGDFDILVNRVRHRYKTPVEVYGVPALTAKTLMNEASCFIPVDEKLLIKKCR
ncbi:NYN domain-containing protein [Candidatus Sororendozoicomonas aggregata]|uniref:LabA-like NYN domain-containing protein n=1 Tax=Candidatus Sororendozoicomonas aggregata TaxID=3073239 RepID=UPI002ED32EE8